MNSPQQPAFKNLKTKGKHSPIELKEKMRKDYKSRVFNSRNLLMNRFRELGVETTMRDTLTEIYETMFKFTNNINLDEDETETLLEVKNELRDELVQEELQWWIEEYEKSQLENVDWSELVAVDDNVICPVCQKNNFTLEVDTVHCKHCNITIKTHKSITELKACIETSVEKHSTNCRNDVQFVSIPDPNGTHIYLICCACNDMLLVF